MVEKSKFGLFHGDLHGENILIGEDSICLIDWRHEFANSLSHGDVYYDLAKFMHGLIVSHAVVANDEYTVKSSFDGYFIDIGLKDSLKQAQHKDWNEEIKFAVVFDRDGTITEDKGYTYKTSDLKIKPYFKKLIFDIGKKFGLIGVFEFIYIYRTSPI